VIDAFRSINPQTMVLGQEPRQTTSNVGHLNKPSIQALIHGLNRHYYSIAIAYRKNELEEKMLLNLHKKRWTDGLAVEDFEEHTAHNEVAMANMVRFANAYSERVKEDVKGGEKGVDEKEVERVGRVDPKRRLEENVTELMSSNINQCLGSMVDTVVFTQENLTEKKSKAAVASAAVEAADDMVEH